MRGWARAGTALLLGAPGCADGALPPEIASAVCTDAPITRPPGSPLWRVELAAASDGALIDASGGAPHVAWDGEQWLVAWSDRVAVLDRDGATRSIDERSDGLAAAAVEAGTCSRAIASQGITAAGTVVSWLDARGEPIREIALDGASPDVARGERGWLVSTSGADGIVVHETDGVGPLVEIDRSDDRALGPPRLAAGSAGATIAWVDGDGVLVRTVGRIDGRAPRTVRAMTVNVWGRGALELAALGEHVIVAAGDGALIHVAVVDPARDVVVAGPTAVARTTSRARPGIAPLPEHGRVALCYPAGPGPFGGADVHDRVEVVVLGRDAEPSAQAVAIAGAPDVRAVACAWSGEELMVVWWSAGLGIAARRIQLGHGPGILAHGR